MYELLDKPAAIREVQGYLYTISNQINSNVPRISIDGIYGSETRDAVIAFQLEYGIPTTGEVDYETFNALALIASDANIEDNLPDCIITNKGLPLRKGNQGDDVLVLNLMLIELLKAYRDIGRVERSTYFSASTERAVRGLQRIFRISETGVVDSRTLGRIKTELNASHRRGFVYQ